MSNPDHTLGTDISRRTLLKGAGVAAGLAAMPTLLAACGGDDEPATTTTAATGGTTETTAAAVTGTVSVGSNASDQVPRDAYQAVYDAFTAKTGIEVAVNTIDHNTFQEQINNYLQGIPDDVFTWFAGYRMQFFAAQGLSTPMTDVWNEVGGNYSSAFKGASTGLDGEQYFMPFYLYPWAVFYRKSLFADKGYTIPTTLDEYKALGDAMLADGLAPIAFADKDGWPAMGTFDYLNMRINGYQYHVDLMGGRESWDSDAVKSVFAAWADLLPYHQQGALGRTWQEAAQSLVNKEAGMYLLGMFVGQQFSDEDRDDLDFFAFPEVNSEFGQDSVEAPIDGLMLSKAPKNLPAAKELLKFLSTGEAQNIYLASDPNNVAAAVDADTSNYNALQKKAVELIGSASHISQFLDRDTRPDFASTVMLPSLQNFINNPSDIDGLVKSIEEQKVAIFGS
jgi:multiple sugar transport system substrate-binding protein